MVYFEDMISIEEKRHTLAHLLAAAVINLHKDKEAAIQLAIGPVIDDGFYYDIQFGPEIKISSEDLPRIEKKMREILKTWTKMERKEIDEQTAKSWAGANTFKHELINEILARGEKVIFYTAGDFTDLCGGGHSENPAKDIAPDSFTLDRVAGAYWRGDEKNPMLTRIYGLAFDTKEELVAYRVQQEEAKKRDHRKLGKELDLFHIDEMVGLGLPLWHPKGALLWRIIEDFWYNAHLKNGYGLVRSPHIGNRILWETSGHWGFYNASMYPPMEVGQSLEDRQQNKKTENSEEYLLKPMNCPFHVQIYKNDKHSYRELPMRWAECGTVYRYEKKGELSGLTRVRGFTQDDAHIICRADQAEDELERVIDFILFMYKSFGFDLKSVNVYLSVRDPQNNKYAGTDEGWNFTENILEKIAIKKGFAYQKDIGGAVFYGPKLDFKIKDALGREWQCSTLQFDFNLPERFKMSFISQNGQEEQPYMLHRALFGSFERFIGLLIEHYGGAFPLWLAPIQVKVLSVSEKHASYAQEIAAALKAENIRAEADDSNESLGKKIREAKMEKIPYLLVVGDKEVEAKTISIDSRDNGKLDTTSLTDFIARATSEIKIHA